MAENICTRTIAKKMKKVNTLLEPNLNHIVEKLTKRINDEKKMIHLKQYHAIMLIKKMISQHQIENKMKNLDMQTFNKFCLEILLN